jgi:hypothetical protein
MGCGISSKQKMLAKTVAALSGSLERYAPGSPYGKFCAWCLNKENPQRRLFLQVLGIYQLINLTDKLFEGLLSEQEWDALLPFCATINAYLTCEAVSDNLAIGLARPKAKDKKAEERREVVNAFNAATVERLKGNTPSAQRLLSPVEAITQQLSMFKSSLSPEKLLYLASTAAKQKQAWSLQDLNASLQAVLVANAETCSEVALTLEELPGSELVRQGLMERYTSVNRLLGQEVMGREERVHVGVHSILVVPTIGYYLTILAHKVRPLAGFEILVADGTLGTALYDSALLVRLLNDLGTPLLNMSRPERQRLITDLGQCWQTEFTPAHSLLDVLAKFTETCQELNRIRKDTLFGEYNLALDLVSTTALPTVVLEDFANNLDYYSELYQRHRQRLATMTTRINNHLQDDLISKVILNFVQFHEMLYGNSFASKNGEYAV